RADEYKAMKAKIDAWRAKTAKEKSDLYKAQIEKTGNKKSNVGFELGYIFPFGIDQSKKILLKVGLVKDGADRGGTEESAATLITELRAQVVGGALYASAKNGTTFPATGSFITDVRGNKKIKPARVRLVQNVAKVDGIESRVTGNPYSYMKKDSVSCVFGQKIGTETSYESAKSALKTALLGIDGRAVYFTPQGEINLEQV
ncbi:MAG TPA: hypothetical protein V6D21_11400, partial [Candidatus Obscuribacterales bacterium]